MSIKFSSKEEMFRFVGDNGVSRTHVQGYHWLWKKFMPSFEKAIYFSKISSKLISDCYYVIGDVHDFNNAPIAAISCYEMALKFSPEMGTAHREIANMFERMGEYDRALSHSDKALALIPNDKFAKSDRSRFAGETRLAPRKLFEKKNVIWDAYEFLAERDPVSALDALKGLKGWDVKRLRLHCFGALRESNNYLDGWTEMANSVNEIEFTFADWFFMEDVVYEESDLWEILLSSDAEFSGVFTIFEGLDQSEKYTALSTHEKIRLRLKFHAYETSGDFVGLRRLYERYPEWVELREHFQT